MPYYEITVQGPLDPATVQDELGLRCTPGDGRVRLIGELVDGAALHGALGWLHGRGLELLAVERRS
jgi:hypothetical protein